MAINWRVAHRPGRPQPPPTTPLELVPGIEEIRTLIREALADLGPLHLTTKEN